MPSKRPPGSSGSPPEDRGPDAGGSGGVCRVLVDGNEKVFEDVAALKHALASGELGNDCRVQLPGETNWTRAVDHPQLAPPAVADDPWAAWDAMESVDESIDEPPTVPDPVHAELEALPSDALVADEPNTPLDELPTEAVRTLPTGPRKGGRFVIEGPKQKARSARQLRPDASSVQLPPKSGAPRTSVPGAADLVAEAPTVMTDMRDAPNNVIAFPSPGGPSTLGPHALAPLHSESLLDLPALQARPRVEPKTGPRWGALALVAFVAFGLVGLVNAWVRHVATQDFTPRLPSKARTVAAVAPVEAVEPAPPPPEAEGPATAIGEVDELTLLDQELRGRIRTDLGSVQRKGDLETSLYVDLSRMNLTDLKVDAVVTAWGGKKRDVPQSAEVQVGFRSRPGELDRELAAVGLIVGRYIQSYELDMARFEVLLATGEDSVRRWPIDPARARNYYIRRSDLPTFLRNMRSVGGR